MRTQPVQPEACEACRRARWRGPQMHPVDLAGVGRTILCVDPAGCRKHWPHDAPGRAA